MNTKNATPPQQEIVNLPYNPSKFEIIISRMTPKNVFGISIEVWAEYQGKTIELLRSGLSGKEFDDVSKHASRMIFRGSSLDLQCIGVV
jgi:hypothetical protein